MIRSYYFYHVTLIAYYVNLFLNLLMHIYCCYLCNPNKVSFRAQPNMLPASFLAKQEPSNIVIPIIELFLRSC